MVRLERTERWDERSREKTRGRINRQGGKSRRGVEEKDEEECTLKNDAFLIRSVLLSNVFLLLKGYFSNFQHKL